MSILMDVRNIEAIEADLQVARREMRFCKTPTVRTAIAHAIEQLAMERASAIAHKVYADEFAKIVAPTAKVCAPVTIEPTVTIERAPIVDNGDDPSIAHGEPTKRAKVGTGKTKPNWHGKPMLCERGTASDGQKAWLLDNGVKPNIVANISMCGASNKRAKMTGKWDGRTS